MIVAAKQFFLTHAASSICGHVKPQSINRPRLDPAWQRQATLLVCFALSAVSLSVGTAAAATPTLRLVDKPADHAIARDAQSQPTAPATAKEVPFVKTSPGPVPTEAEKQRGYIIFQRPTCEPIYPNTRPLPHERIESVGAFATPGQFQLITFALYPLRPLQNVKVRASALSGSGGEIPADNIDIRLATFWNIGYPGYTTVATYRRVPELLEHVTAHSSPERECQRYWLTVHVPDNAAGGLYHGSVKVWDDDYNHAIEIPLALRVLDFKLQKDPQKHFSAYYSVRDRSIYKGRSEEFINRATGNDYRTMVEFGLDMIPTFYLSYQNGRIGLANAGELQRMIEAGLKGPVPVCGDNAIGGIYRQTTPKGKTQSHWHVDPLPPPEFYDHITEAMREFEKDRKAKGWPEFVYCPVDEVDAGSKEFGVKVYAAVKAAGVRTYATKDPSAVDAADYAPHLDIWCSQPYSVPYDRIVSQKRFEYWCYPNHNACEVRDPVTMCKGGRMTYGFGLWRSGYTTLIPWHWSWTCEPDAMDYLRGKYSGCGQRMDDEAQVIPTVYWECFRQGNDDGRYIYTLQQAIVEREGSDDLACRTAVAQGRRLLQETWNAIRVQQKYLAEGMWQSEDFDAIRWLLATQTQLLLRFPVTKAATAPSVLVADTATTNSAAEPSALLEAAKSGKVEVLDLLSGGPWENGTAEGKLQVSEAARREGRTGLRWVVDVDHRHDGGEGGDYPIGWPRISREFKQRELDLTRFDSLVVWVRVDSDRDEVSDDHTPIGLTISAHGVKKSIYETAIDIGDRPRMWVPIRFSVKEMMERSGTKTEAWKSVSRVQLYISESDFRDRTHLLFDIGDVSLIRPTSPMIDTVDAPMNVLLPRGLLAVRYSAIGTAGGRAAGYAVEAAIEDSTGKSIARTQQDLLPSAWIAISMKGMEPRIYTLRLRVLDAKGAICSEWAQPIHAHAGPLY